MTQNSTIEVKPEPLKIKPSQKGTNQVVFKVTNSTPFIEPLLSNY